MNDSVQQPDHQAPHRPDGRNARLNWAARLYEHRARTFVGRDAELELIRHALHAERPNFQCLALIGAPGTGKTTLLKRYAAECGISGVSHKLIDARRIQPAPRSFWHAFRSALDLTEDDALTPALARRGRFILMIDNYDALYPLHDWLCENVLPHFPASTICVVASREPLPDLWRTDPAWRELVHTVSLRNFSPDETRAYLTLRAVPRSEHERLISFSRGHPLALSLVADLFNQRSDFLFDPQAAPDIMQPLVRRFAGDVTDPHRRMALEASAIARVTTEALLAAMLDRRDVRTEFEWLCGLSFFEISPAGVYPHDLVRDVLSRDLLWRDAHRYETLRQRARDFFAPLLRHQDRDVQGEALADYLFLYRSNDALRPFWEGLDGEPILPKTEEATPDDHPRLLELVRQHEGEESAGVLAHWLKLQPEGAWVIRGEDGQARAFTLIVRLDRANSAETQADPLMGEVWKYLHQNKLLQGDDVATVTRFVVDAKSYQDVTPQISSLAVSLLRHCLTVPNLKFTLNILAHPEFWEPFANASGFFKRVKELHFEVAGRTMGVFMQDWRHETPEMWLSQIAPGRRNSGTARNPDGTEEERLLEQRSEFAKAVRHALKNFHVEDALLLNPLVNSSLVTNSVKEASDSVSKTRALQAAIAEVVEFLGTVPKRRKLYQALRYTYLEPQGSQERVAEWLELPFSTYRGHLRGGIDVLTDILWRKDMEARRAM